MRQWASDKEVLRHLVLPPLQHFGSDLAIVPSILLAEAALAPAAAWITA